MNHGPTVLVSARHGGVINVMAAAWACVRDYGQTLKVTVVRDKATFTRELVSGVGWAGPGQNAGLVIQAVARRIGLRESRVT